MLESQKARRFAANISVFASIFIFALKIVAYNLTHSAAVLSDALESTVNVIAAIVALFVIRFASEPADDEHPYGHGKAEYFSAAFEGGLIFFAAVLIVFESVKALIKGTVLHQLELGMAVVAGAAVLNLVLGLYLKQMGKKQNSQALEASGAHVLSDVWTTVGVAVGLLLVKLTGWLWWDSLAAILVGVHLAWVGFGIVRESLSGLIDAADPKVLENLTQSMNKNRARGVIDVHHLRVIRAGAFHHVDAHLVVPEYWNVANTHSVTHEFEEKVVADYGIDGEIAFHIDPCKRAYCSICDVFDCPVRVSQFKELRQFSVASLTGVPQPTDQKYGQS